MGTRKQSRGQPRPARARAVWGARSAPQAAKGSAPVRRQTEASGGRGAPGSRRSGRSRGLEPESGRLVAGDSSLDVLTVDLSLDGLTDGLSLDGLTDDLSLDVLTVDWMRSAGAICRPRGGGIYPPLAGAFRSVFDRFLTISGRFFTRSDFASIYQLLQTGHNQL